MPWFCCHVVPVRAEQARDDAIVTSALHPKTGSFHVLQQACLLQLLCWPLLACLLGFSLFPPRAYFSSLDQQAAAGAHCIARARLREACRPLCTKPARRLPLAATKLAERVTACLPRYSSRLRESRHEKKRE